MKRNLFGIMLLSGISILPKANAQTTYEEMEQLTVNEQITTVITASEPVRFVDISTDKVAGDQPIDNIIRLKPKESGHEDGEILAIVTIVTERYITAIKTESGRLWTIRAAVNLESGRAGRKERSKKFNDEPDDRHG